jgi:hypothetical protein
MIAQETGWTIEYIIWELSVIQIALILEAHDIITDIDLEENETVNLDELPPEEQEKHLAALFGGGIM